jgi:hypothetical protein
MKQISRPLAALAIALLAHPALAQNQPGAGGFGGNGLSGPAPTARPTTPDIIPAGVPGAAGTLGIATAPKLKKTNTGNPTTDLFAAINKGNYGDAQDAISRGADLNAQNPLGETPLDLAIALNQNSITFMLLSARNEGDAGQPVQTTSAAPAASTTPHPIHAKLHPIAAKAMASTAEAPAHAKATPAPAGNAGQPNVSVGFLGFGQK